MATSKRRINITLDASSRAALDELRRRPGFNLCRLVERRLSGGSLAERLREAIQGATDWGRAERAPSVSVYLSHGARATLDELPNRLRAAWVRAVIKAECGRMRAGCIVLSLSDRRL